jgi:Helitron helicase-like domain at N-terminus/PIF1-like helicase
MKMTNIKRILWTCYYALFYFGFSAILNEPCNYIDNAGAFCPRDCVVALPRTPGSSSSLLCDAVPLEDITMKSVTFKHNEYDMIGPDTFQNWNTLLLSFDFSYHYRVQVSAIMPYQQILRAQIFLDILHYFNKNWYWTSSRRKITWVGLRLCLIESLDEWSRLYLNTINKIYQTGCLLCVEINDILECHCWPTISTNSAIFALLTEVRNNFDLPPRYRYCCHAESSGFSQPKRQFGGGGEYLDMSRKKSWTFTGQELMRFSREDNRKRLLDVSSLKFVDHVYRIEAFSMCAPNTAKVAVDIPIKELAKRLPAIGLRLILDNHGIHYQRRDPLSRLRTLLQSHEHCPRCDEYTNVFCAEVNNELSKQGDELCTKRKTPKEVRYQHRRLPVRSQQKNSLDNKNENAPFPPLPCSISDKIKMARGFLSESSVESSLKEDGCAVCGRLAKISTCTSLKDLKKKLSILESERPGVTRKERLLETQSIEEISGPIIDRHCSVVCDECTQCLSKKTVPLLALANGNWIGEVPVQLKDLSFAEKLLVARTRKNRCVVRVQVFGSKGFSKMIANAALFPNPVVKIAKRLPPHRNEIDQALAIIFTGPNSPASEELRRTPLLVRHRKVMEALQWLKLNHIDYSDVIISKNNMQSYDDDDIPVPYTFQLTESSNDTLTQPVTVVEDDYGTATGECPFRVHGITGSELPIENKSRLTALAMEHLRQERPVLAIRSRRNIETIWNNPQLYPMAFPWLFPYGLGGIGNNRGHAQVPDHVRLKQLLLYHDKRFQVDPEFPLVAFSHRQIKNCSIGSYLLAQRDHFDEIAEKIMTIDPKIIEKIAENMKSGVSVKPTTDAEKECYNLINNLDHIACHVEGSATNRKYMRKEIWSLLCHLGAPSWYITFAPADIKHPLCIYFASRNGEVRERIGLPELNVKLVTSNPVASARFFDVMVKSFLKHVVREDGEQDGLFGRTSGYYGSVEQQGRLTLHLHLLLWIKNSPSPKQIRERLINDVQDFQQRMIQYLEDRHIGEFMTGPLAEVHEKLTLKKSEGRWEDPSTFVPEVPHRPCPSGLCKNCKNCRADYNWYCEFMNDVDDVVYHSNQHDCKKGPCARLGYCKGRFPRELIKQTMIDIATGHIFLKKGEAFINTFSPLLSYLLRCNTDVTSLLSGTAVKAVIAYVTDYISKNPLKTYAIFETIKSVFDKTTVVVRGELHRKEHARKLLTSIVNSLTVKMEIGSPMACAYLLENGDHYTSHRFRSFFWYRYVRRVLCDCASDDSLTDNAQFSETLLLAKNGDKVVGLSPVDDYTLRPKAYENMNLYDWISTSSKVSTRKNKKDCALNRESLSHETNQENIDYQRGVGCLPAENGVTNDIIGDSHPSDNSDSEGSDIETPVAGKVKQCLIDYQFLAGHPQRYSHKISVNTKDPFIPNFVGRLLPRADRGDREFYCATMLTLFKPWRNGTHLKDSNKSWDDSFMSHAFTERQAELMGNFNLRYECLDARDDFTAKKKDFPLPWALDRDGVHELESDNIIDETQEEQSDAILQDSFPVLGKATRARSENMLQCEQIAETSGWLDKSIDGLIPIENINVNINKFDSKSMRSLLEAEKVRRVQSRFDHMSTTSNTGITEVTKKPAQDMQNVDEEVSVITIHHLFKRFVYPTATDKSQVDETCKLFNLNTEQERAFKIVAHHSLHSTSEQLKMYLGGMAGTGKSQVIKALTHFFRTTNSSHAFALCAPTGSAAALIGGTTYHALLAMNPKNSSKASADQLARIRDIIKGVKYIFLDEVSMVGPRDLYTISRRLCEALNRHDVPFGGLNVILAGDFAQLPPVGQPTLYSKSIGTKRSMEHSILQQEASIGKAIWHEFTTVVVLRKNMRQNSQTQEDNKLRKALENLRYKACTKSDVTFLKTLVAGRMPGKVKLNQSKFRDVSVIVGYNAYRDQLNLMGAKRFAQEHDQPLHEFYSIDSYSTRESENDLRRRSRRRTAAPPRNGSNCIPEYLQNALWNLPHGATDHIPGKLILCKGMPVMIKYNYATECCVTNGAEATVVDWISTPTSAKKHVLDVLFVKLKNPPKDICLQGLPSNVVPIYRRSENIKCLLPNDSILDISRSQVNVIPNFGMTDYASQGRTRPFNPVELNSCGNHLSYYTCLSRSASASGTVIVQGFDVAKITGGASQSLREEFRDIELLDYITKLRFEGKLNDAVVGDRRYTLIKEFQLVYGRDFVPKTVPNALDWKKSKDIANFEMPSYDAWEIIREPEKQPKGTKRKPSEDANVNRKRTKYSICLESLLQPAKGSIPLKVLSNDKKPIRQPRALEKTVFDSPSTTPSGLKWSAENTCAYDALFTILHHLWTVNQTHQYLSYARTNRFWQLLHDSFEEHRSGSISLERARDRMRIVLSKEDPGKFPNGRNTSVTDLADKIFDTSSILRALYLTCNSCNGSTKEVGRFLTGSGFDCNKFTWRRVERNEDYTERSTFQWLNKLLGDGWRSPRCKTCKGYIHGNWKFEVSPQVLYMDVAYAENIHIDLRMCLDPAFFSDNRSVNTYYKLSGVVYFDANLHHWVCRIIQRDGLTWFHDGMKNFGKCIEEGFISAISVDQLRSISPGVSASLLIYTLE